ncbi:hypothetical protein [Altibacter sp. HG106]|uniref:hypothetical protein n=1 Tax=Altibacter sp. HG106 TaxID=3023937 RepID=UPI0023503254|nr:hypothetical protein [Altibacter sp. HG106]MDC7995627.1 hypothetical protein [Altibacter sp. HG106]
MKRRKNILFFILELISGFGIGILGTLLVTPEKPKFDLNLSILIGFLTICVFALIGIGIPGFFHSRMNNNNKKFGNGMEKAAIGILIGIVIGGILSAITYSFLPYRISSFYIPILTSILGGVIGFNIGIQPRIELNKK